MKRVLFVVLLSLLMATVANSKYIKNDKKYTLLHTKEYYMTLAKSMHNKKEFTFSQIQDALQNENKSQLSNAFRALAYDEVRDDEKLQKYLKRITPSKKIYKKSPELSLALADILLRQGKYDAVVEMLPKEEALLMDNETRLKTYYYIAMAKYLKTGKFSPEFIAIKNRFKAARDIYYFEKGTRK